MPVRSVFLSQWAEGMLRCLDLLNCSSGFYGWGTGSIALVRISCFFPTEDWRSLCQRSHSLFYHTAIMLPSLGQNTGWWRPHHLSSAHGMWQPCFWPPNGTNQDRYLPHHLEAWGDYSAARDRAENQQGRNMSPVPCTSKLYCSTASFWTFCRLHWEHCTSAGLYLWRMLTRGPGKISVHQSILVSAK